MKVVKVENTKVYTLKLTSREINTIIDLMRVFDTRIDDKLNDEELQLLNKLKEVLKHER